MRTSFTIRHPGHFPIALAVLCLAALWSPPVAAEQRPRTNTKHACDWSFNSGPRAGQIGKESRIWLGRHPTYDSIAWWRNGNYGSVTMTYSNPISFPASGREVTLWDVDARAGGAQIPGQAVLGRSLFGGPSTQRSLYFFTNGAELDCLELNYNALEDIRTAYQRAGAVCDCRAGVDYAATVACVEGCAAWWNDPSRWWLGPKPSCLGGTKVVPKAGCLLDNDPRVNPEDPDPDIDPSP